jgi:hypothetical protein
MLRLPRWGEISLHQPLHPWACPSQRTWNGRIEIHSARKEVSTSTASLVRRGLSLHCSSAIHEWNDSGVADRATFRGLGTFSNGRERVGGSAP